MFRHRCPCPYSNMRPSVLFLLALPITVCSSNPSDLAHAKSLTLPRSSQVLHSRSHISRRTCSRNQITLAIIVLDGVAQWARRARSVANRLRHPNNGDDRRRRIFHVAFVEENEGEDDIGEHATLVSHRMRYLLLEAERSPGGRLATNDWRGRGSVLIACENPRRRMCEDEDDLVMVLNEINTIILVSYLLHWILDCLVCVLCLPALCGYHINV